ncbi:MAG: helix-turn-helix domain-containing protein [Lachnospiraceae bacterium]
MIEISFEEEEYYNRQRLKNELVVSAAGHYRLVTQKSLTTDRTYTPDYLLLYIAEGVLHIYADEQEILLPAGNIYLYYPDTHQHFTYLLEEHPDVYWIHFFDGYVDDILTSCGFTEEGSYPVGQSVQIEAIFNKIIEEPHQKSLYYRETSLEYLKLLLYTLGRGYHSSIQEQMPAGGLNHQIERDIAWFYHHYRETFQIQEYAKKENISVNWFIRRFKRYTGKTPLHFLNELRIEKAKELLISQYFSTTEIAHMVGFEDATYFAKIFKRQEGLTPSQYRDHIQKQ